MTVNLQVSVSGLVSVMTRQDGRMVNTGPGTARLGPGPGTGNDNCAVSLALTMSQSLRPGDQVSSTLLALLIRI